ncbi:MAG: hypothetical protein LUQ07_05690, partial [Methanospirillum sp.]|nr:hypothetical protein [Methanospirillum sp.]
VEGMSGLIGVIRKESSGLILIEYSPVLFEEYEDHLSIFADECKTRARQNSPVILLASYTDSVIMELGSCADRFLSISDNGKRSKKTDRNEKYQITLADPGIFGIPTGTMVVPPVRYGQLSLDVG